MAADLMTGLPEYSGIFRNLLGLARDKKEGEAARELPAGLQHQVKGFPLLAVSVMGGVIHIPGQQYGHRLVRFAPHT
jgi:hypothetical protein